MRSFPNGTEWVGLFRQIGLGQWFRYFTGAVEILGGVLVLVPRPEAPKMTTRAALLRSREAQKQQAQYGWNWRRWRRFEPIPPPAVQAPYFFAGWTVSVVEGRALV